ncbi:MAG: 5-formyltetrahydrofolate cyclo-ligase, partial [Bacteroidales bacterium]|nr:5-formyltetrahydrofolate cyclo-ligase [Bacteroidales bacterium]
KTILSYWSMDDEVNTHDFNLHFSSKKDIYLPSIQEDKLLIKKFISLQDLVPTGKYQIPEPNGEPIEDIGLIDLIIVPGMAFDRHLNRLGRGKAYYDKLLKNKEKIKVGLCFDFQLFDTIPHDLEDVKMSKIVSASEII